MLLAPARAIVVGVTVAVSAGGLSGCGASVGRAIRSSSSVRSSSATTSRSAPVGPAPRGLERALVRSAGRPRPSASSCRTESGSERAASPFGSSGPSVYACALTVNGSLVPYDVQLLRNGCFVAERHRPGKAIYGCGAGIPARLRASGGQP